MNERPTRLAIAIQLIALAVVAVVAVVRAPDADWDLALLGTLIVLGVASDLLRIEVRAYRIFVSASFLAIVLAAVFAGVTPAVLIGVVTILASWARERYPRDYLLINLVTYASSRSSPGLVFEAVSEGYRDRPGLRRLLPARLRVFVLSLAIDFVLIAGYSCYVERSRFGTKVRRALVPLLPSELASALLTVARRARLRRARDRRDGPVRGRDPDLPVPRRRAAGLPGARATSSSCAPASSPASRSRCSRRCFARSTCATG